MARDTGFPDADAEFDFQRQRRRASMSRLAAWIGRQPSDINDVLPFAEVIDALDRVGERTLGLKSIPVASIVGSVDRTEDFDKYFRPTSARVRQRWQRLAAAQRRGESMPPIQVYRVGEMHFVIDGHHRVSIAIARGFDTIDAYVTEVLTRISATGISARGDLHVKDYRRIFALRVPLEPVQRGAIQLTEGFDYTVLAETVEAWGFRLIQEKGEYLDRAEVARRWFGEEFLPVVRMARAAGIMPESSDAEVFLFVECERYRLVRRHIWDDEIMAEVGKVSRQKRRR